MASFEVGDKVQMSGVPIVVEVLELGVCEDEDCCTEEVFRFVDPVHDEEDWAHAHEFVKASA